MKYTASFTTQIEQASLSLVLFNIQFVCSLLIQGEKKIEIDPGRRKRNSQSPKVPPSSAIRSVSQKKNKYRSKCKTQSSNNNSPFSRPLWVIENRQSECRLAMPPLTNLNPKPYHEIAKNAPPSALRLALLRCRVARNRCRFPLSFFFWCSINIFFLLCPYYVDRK